MNAPARLGAFALVLAAVFGVSYLTAGAVVGDDLPRGGLEQQHGSDHQDREDGDDHDR